MSAPGAGAALADLLAEAEHRLAVAGVASPAFDARALAGHVLGVPPGRLPAAAQRPLDAAAADRLWALVARRAQREPLQHLLGSAAFRWVEVAVGPGVFIPRPETEMVVEQAIRMVRGVPAPRCVDLCTGSGAIALSLARELDGAEVWAVELDPAAAAWAQRNLAGSGVQLALGGAGDALAELDATIDLVVSNPPYLPEGCAPELDPEVGRHDPALALYGGPDGLAVLAVVARRSARLLRPGGAVVLEHGPDQGAAVQALLGAAGLVGLSTGPDLTGRDRWTAARRP